MVVGCLRYKGKPKTLAQMDAAIGREVKSSKSMTAVDTNVLVRLLAEDDLRQTKAAKLIFSSGPVWIAKTVLLETSWVLSRAYEFGEPAIREAFTRLLGLKNVNVEDDVSVLAALAFMEQGLDFADAMHLASRPPGAAFVSFDQAFIRRAKRAGATDVSVLPPV